MCYIFIAYTVGYSWYHECTAVHGAEIRLLSVLSVITLQKSPTLYVLLFVGWVSPGTRVEKEFEMILRHVNMGSKCFMSLAWGNVLHGPRGAVASCWARPEERGQECRAGDRWKGCSWARQWSPNGSLAGQVGTKWADSLTVVCMAPGAATSGIKPSSG